MTAFDDIERTDNLPPSHLISHADYLNESARPEAAKVRALIDTWLRRYPREHRVALIARLRSRNDTDHRSAFLELFLHEICLRNGYEILAVEPVLPNGKAPDFLVQTPTGEQFYLEATLANAISHADAGAHRRMRDLVQAIDEVRSPDFFLNLHTQGLPSSQVATSKLRRKVQTFVDGLDYDESVARLEAGDALPVFQDTVQGVHIIIQVMPKRTRRDGRAIGGRILPGGIVTPHEAVKSAAQGKAARYGTLDLPLVVAINGLNDFVDVDDAIDALFGTTAAMVPESGEPYMIRNTDGVWRGPSGPVWTRLSAVLFLKRLSPWDLAQRSAHLILNPWAQNPLEARPAGMDVHTVVDGNLTVAQGISLRSFLELPEHWPEN